MNNYPEQFDHLQRLVAKLMMEEPGTLGGFRHLHKESQAEGALPTQDQGADGARDIHCGDPFFMF
jgi:hypothetical protein